MAESTAKSYDFIFAGGGMAAASLLLRMVEIPEFAEKRILVIDPLPFGASDKTWCFWEKGEGFFEPLVEKSWSKARFSGADFEKELQLLPYRYKMIRSQRFFENTRAILQKHPNVVCLAETVSAIEQQPGGLKVTTQSGSCFESQTVFSSIPPQVQKKPDHFYLLQHFAGWFVETDRDVFNAEVPVLMDFSISQQNDCRFVYILPIDARKALVEYTIFSENLLEEEEYQAALRLYMEKFLPASYRITEYEKGLIPMYSEPFPKSRMPGVIQLGTSGNNTKASTGYTFQKVQKHSDAILRQLLSGKKPSEDSFDAPARFAWFDRVLLRVLAERKVPGRVVFESLFRKNPVQRVFRFLDEESNPAEEFLLMNTVPVRKFMLPGIRELMR